MVTCKAHGRQASINGKCIKCLWEAYKTSKVLRQRLAAYAPAQDHQWLLVRSK